MVNEEYLVSRLFEIRRKETAIRGEFDSGVVMLVQNHAKGKPVSEIKGELDEQRRIRADMLRHPYELYLELQEEAKTAAPQLVEPIGRFANMIYEEIIKYGRII